MKLTLKQKRALTRLCPQYGVILLYAYGSRVRGDIHQGSDLDLAHQSQRLLGFLSQYELQTKLARVFGIDDGKIDLVNIETAPPLLLHFIATEGEKVFGAARADDAFYRRALKRHLDAKPLLEATKQYVQRYARV